MSKHLLIMHMEIALWEKFGWGPDQTSKLTLEEIRVLFEILGREDGEA